MGSNPAASQGRVENPSLLEWNKDVDPMSRRGKTGLNSTGLYFILLYSIQDINPHILNAFLSMDQVWSHFFLAFKVPKLN